MAREGGDKFAFGFAANYGCQREDTICVRNKKLSLAF
jgi:hypothetical protein